MRSTISLLGLYNYDSSILDGLTLPSNFTAAELAALKTNLLMETAEFELLYSNFDFLKYAITQWCEKRKSTWEWLKNTQNYNYNPLENVDMHLEDHLGSKLEKDVITDFERHLKSAKTGHDDFDSDVNKTGHDDFDSNVHKTGHDDFDSDVKKTGDDKDEKRGTDTILHSVYAFNENSAPSPESQDGSTFNSDLTHTYDNNVNTDSITTYNNNVNTDSSTTYNNNVNTDSTTTYNNVVDDTGTTKNTVDHDEQLKKNYNKDWHGRDHMSAQELIKQEQELAMFNLLDFIIDDFKKRFCLLVY